MAAIRRTRSEVPLSAAAIAWSTLSTFRLVGFYIVIGRQSYVSSKSSHKYLRTPLRATQLLRGIFTQNLRRGSEQASEANFGGGGNLKAKSQWSRRAQGQRTITTHRINSRGQIIECSPSNAPLCE